MILMIRKNNRTGEVLATAETDTPDPRSVGSEGPGQSIVSLDAGAVKRKPVANGKWFLTGDERVLEYRGSKRKQQTAPPVEEDTDGRSAGNDESVTE